MKSESCPKLSALECKFGKLSVLKEKEVLKAFVEREIGNKQMILEKLQCENTEKSKGRAEEMKALLEELQEMLKQIS